MSQQRRGLGRWGEDRAARLLRRKGFRIVERNWHSARGELDLIAVSDDEWVFVEVNREVGRLFG